MGWPMAGREAAGPTTRVFARWSPFARRELLSRILIVAATVAAGVGLALVMMQDRAPPRRVPVTIAPPAPAKAGSVLAAPVQAAAPAARMQTPLPLRPREAPAPPPSEPAQIKPKTGTAKAPPHERAAPRVIVVVRPAPARRPGCEASASRAETLICTHPALANAERDDQRAARRAAAAGRRTDPAEWLAVREAAAQRGPEALAEAYRRHTSALNRLAEPPH